MKPTQKEAIDTLLTYLDELENKPRRLFHALEEVALAFELDNCVPSIREAQDRYYGYYNKGDYLRDIYYTLTKHKINVWKQQVNGDISMDDANNAIYSAEKFADSLSKNLLED